ncbi:MAG: 3-oxoacid CoA-transferase [Candidatus Bathyarchaeota archaeon]|nr:3-oxoacid CoA-transferase [Candidatus Bathyarchaeota archaeon]
MKKKGRKYSDIEIMAYIAAKQIEDCKSVFVGTGLPMIATILAQRTHAPNILIVFEAGGIGPQIPVLPISVGDSRTFYKGLAASSMHEAMSAAQSGYIDYGFLGAAQIDMYGNINTTVIGNHDKPKVRLPGSGGGNDVGSLCHRTITIMRQDKKRFVKKLDFLTTPGYLTGPGSREKVGLPEDTGPYRVITQLGVYGFDNTSKRMRLLSMHPGITIEEIKENCEFDLIIPDEVESSMEPTQKDIDMLKEIDPTGIVIRR